MLWAGGAAAQVAANRSTLYLHPTEVSDARAVWLDPAGPAFSADASVYLELVVRQPGASGRLGQVNAGFSSRGLAFGYQRDYIDDLVGHTYRLAFGSGVGSVAAGAAVAFYRGNASAKGWDVGLRYTPSHRLVLGAVLANIGEPEVRGVLHPMTFVPSVTVAPLGRAITASALAHITSDAVLGYAFGLRLRLSTVAALKVRLDTDRELRRASLAVGLAIGARDVLGAVATASGDARDVDAVSLHGITSRKLER